MENAHLSVVAAAASADLQLNLAFLQNWVDLHISS